MPATIEYYPVLANVKASLRSDPVGYGFASLGPCGLRL
jgi:hypothetical protein